VHSYPAPTTATAPTLTASQPDQARMARQSDVQPGLSILCLWPRIRLCLDVVVDRPLSLKMSFGVEKWLWRRFGANQIAPIKRACRRSIFARPYIWRLTSLSLVI
jgi:hypothetical protein